MQSRYQHLIKIQFVLAKIKLKNGSLCVKTTLACLLNSQFKLIEFLLGTTIQKNMAPNSLQFGQSMNNSSLQPSPQISFIPYDQLFGPNALMGPTQTPQNNASSQLLGSQLVQPR
jgi:hypothetical protein